MGFISRDTMVNHEGSPFDPDHTRQPSFSDSSEKNLILPSAEIPDTLVQVAQTIGGDVTPERVAALIEKANEGRFLFHGKKYGTIRESGIAPTTPEGGFVSFWTSGTSLFIGEVSQSGKINTRDTSFFDYGHSTLAITQAALIKDYTGNELKFNPNRQHQLPFNVPHEALTYIRVINPGLERTREVGQRVEQAMFSALEDVLSSDLPGGVIIKNLAYPDSAV